MHIYFRQALSMDPASTKLKYQHTSVRRNNSGNFGVGEETEKEKRLH